MPMAERGNLALELARRPLHADAHGVICGEMGLDLKVVHVTHVTHVTRVAQVARDSCGSCGSSSSARHFTFNQRHPLGLHLRQRALGLQGMQHRQRSAQQRIFVKRLPL